MDGRGRIRFGFGDLLSPRSNLALGWCLWSSGVVRNLFDLGWRLGLGRRGAGLWRFCFDGVDRSWSRRLLVQMSMGSLAEEIIDVLDSSVGGDHMVWFESFEVLVVEAKVDNEGSEERHVAWELTIVLQLLPSEEGVHVLLYKRESLVIELPQKP